ncbi:hypothetical protein ABPG75_007620 [Micractinium tetrahymenae]
MSAFEVFAAWRPAANTAIGISQAAAADPSPDKVDLSVGAYRTEEGRELILGAVREAQRRLEADPATNHEYLGHGGNPRFCRLAAELALGAGSAALAEGRVASIQGVSGTGSLWVGAAFLSRYYRRSRVALLSAPSWPLHDLMMERAGLELRRYRYYDETTRGLDYEGMLEDLRAAPQGTILVLQGCGHNPTGVDPTPQQWQGILAAAQERQLFVFMDNAYQGFVCDLEEDAAAVRLFVDAGLELLVAQSFSKSMGLYGERVGALHLVAASADVARGAEAALQELIVPMYATPPKYGAAIATTILADPQLRQQWQRELAELPGSMLRRRQQLYDALQEVGVPGSWEHILKQRGMFSYTGLTEAQCGHLMERWHVYLTPDGRISLTGLTGPRCRYVAEAFKDAILACPA